jgi:hypothetical protein
MLGTDRAKGNIRTGYGMLNPPAKNGDRGTGGTNKGIAYSATGAELA